MELRNKFILNNDITFLNHGSFGACPKEVFEEYQYFQRLLEENPVQFFIHESRIHLENAKLKLAEFIHCNANDFFFLQNPTFAINQIINSLDFQKGDEILTTNHEYGALINAWNYYENKNKFKFVQANISLPIISKEKILEEFWSAYTKKTKAIYISHLTSASALIFPIKEIIQKAKELNLITIIDGAHAPGHIELNLNILKPDFYTGTCHKWILSPKGSSFLYVDKNFQDTLQPLLIGWGYFNKKRDFLEENQIQGTRDNAAFYTVKKAIEFYEENNWKQRTEETKIKVQIQYRRFCNVLNIEPICPLNTDFLGLMCSIPIKTQNPLKLKEILFKKYKIEVPIMELNGQYYLRITYQNYNTTKDLDVLYHAIEDIQKQKTLIV